MISVNGVVAVLHPVQKDDDFPLAVKHLFVGILIVDL